MEKKQANLFKSLLAESETKSCQKVVRQLQSITSVIDRNYPCVNEQLFSKLARKISEVKRLMSDSDRIKDLNKLQGTYQKKRNVQNYELDCAFRFDDFGNYYCEDGID